MQQLPLPIQHWILQQEPAVQQEVQSVVSALSHVMPDSVGLGVASLAITPSWQSVFQHPDKLPEAFQGATHAHLIQRLITLQKIILRLQDQSNPDSELSRRLILAVAPDLRVILIEMAVVQTQLRYLLRAKNNEHSKRLGWLAKIILAPLANQLGIWQLKWELEDLSLRALEPTVYHTIADSLEEKRSAREARIHNAIRTIQSALQAAHIEATISGRPKHIYSIYNKMRRKKIPLEQLYDLHAIRIFVSTEEACYSALSIVQSLWPVIDGEFDDYIAKPKANGYQSLHTAVLEADGKPLEVQIRTHSMHEQSELGVASHWYYKESGHSHTHPSEQLQRVALLRRLLAWQSAKAGDTESIDDFALEQTTESQTIFVFTPEGKILDLPYGSTPLDFAYAIHSDLGHRCRGAKIDGHLVALNTLLHSGQTVEIIPAKIGTPSRDWLNPDLHYLGSPRSRNKVKQWFSRHAKDEWVGRGRQWLEEHLRELKASQTNLETLARKLDYKTVEALLAAAGRNEITSRHLRHAIHDEVEEDSTRIPAGALNGAVPIHSITPPLPSASSILFVGVDRLLMHFAGCCKPVRPDAIIGFITRTKGITVHRADCANLASMDAQRLIPAAWSETLQEEESFEMNLQVEGSDRPNLLRDLTEILAKEKINVRAVQLNTRQRAGQNTAHLRLTIVIRHRNQLDGLLHQLQQVPGVHRVNRM